MINISSPSRCGNTLTTRVRTVITRSGAIIRGKFPSRKNGRMIHHEGLLELEACCLFEMLPSVLEYREQPLKVKYPDGPRLRTYTPDFELTLNTGQRVLVEVKHSAILARKEIGEKYGKIAAHLRSEGINYVIITEKVIRHEPRLAILKKAAAALVYPRPTDALVRNTIRRIPAEIRTVSELEKYLKPHRITAADLLAAGYLICDLDNALSASTRVLVTKEPNHEWLRICKELPF